MWLASFLPDFVWPLLIVAGIIAVAASVLLKNIPILKYVGIIAVLIGTWMEGNITNEAKWQAKVAELEAKVAAAEAKAAEENVKIVTKVVKKREYYKVRGNDIIQYVDREIIKYDNTCTVPKEVIKAHNDAAAHGAKK